MVTRDSSSRRIIQQLQRDVAELRQLVANQQRATSADSGRHSFLALTTCGPDDAPQYPASPANVFRIAFIDAAFEPEPGMRPTIYKLRNAPTVKYGATARNLVRPGWVPEGTPVVAHWQRSWGGSQNGEWWFEAAAGQYVSATLSKPLRHDDSTAYLNVGAIDLDSGLPVNVFTADNTLLHWQGLTGDVVLLRQTVTGWVVWQPRMHSVCVAVDVLDSESASGDHPGALTKIELNMSTTFGHIPTTPCTIVEYASCDAGSTSGGGDSFDPPPYAFAYDANVCCDAGSVGSGSEFSGGDGSGSCETGQGMTGSF